MLHAQKFLRNYDVLLKWFYFEGRLTVLRTKTTLSRKSDGKILHLQLHF